MSRDQCQFSHEWLSVAHDTSGSSPSLADGALTFGDCVTFSRNDGPRQSHRIVGEDEADPRQGTISYASPLAHALMGKVVGDLVPFGKDEIEILSISR